MAENFRDGDNGDEDEESTSHRNNIVGKDDGLLRAAPELLARRLCFRRGGHDPG